MNIVKIVRLETKMKYKDLKSGSLCKIGPHTHTYLKDSMGATVRLTGKRPGGIRDLSTVYNRQVKKVKQYTIRSK